MWTRLSRRVSWFFLKTLGSDLVACVLSHHSVSMSCKLLQPVVVVPQDARTTVTIPAGAVVEVRPTVRKGGIAELLWKGECFSAQLEDVLGACRIDDVGSFGWY
jgi:hypothetical protein